MTVILMRLNPRKRPQVRRQPGRRDACTKPPGCRGRKSSQQPHILHAFRRICVCHPGPSREALGHALRIQGGPRFCDRTILPLATARFPFRADQHGQGTSRVHGELIHSLSEYPHLVTLPRVLDRACITTLSYWRRSGQRPHEMEMLFGTSGYVITFHPAKDRDRNLRVVGKVGGARRDGGSGDNHDRAWGKNDDARER